MVPLSEKDLFLVLATDGIWNVLSNQEVRRVLIKQFLEFANIMIYPVVKLFPSRNLFRTRNSTRFLFTLTPNALNVIYRSRISVEYSV